MARIHMTPMVKVALYALRIYLVIMLALIVVKFVVGFSNRKEISQHPAPVPSPTISTDTVHQSAGGGRPVDSSKVK